MKTINTYINEKLVLNKDNIKNYASPKVHIPEEGEPCIGFYLFSSESNKFATSDFRTLDIMKIKKINFDKESEEYKLICYDIDDEILLIDSLLFYINKNGYLQSIEVKAGSFYASYVIVPLADGIEFMENLIKSDFSSLRDIAKLIFDKDDPLLSKKIEINDRSKVTIKRKLDRAKKI